MRFTLEYSIYLREQNSIHRNIYMLAPLWIFQKDYFTSVNDYEQAFDKLFGPIQFNCKGLALFPTKNALYIKLLSYRNIFVWFLYLLRFLKYKRGDCFDYFD